MGMTITNFWKLFRYGVKRYHFENLIGIREFLEKLSLDCFNNPFLTDTWTPEKNIPPLDEVDEGDTVSTWISLNFSISVYLSTEFSTISDITLNSA